MMARTTRSMLIVSGRNSGIMVWAMKSTVISGTERISSM